MSMSSSQRPLRPVLSTTVSGCKQNFRARRAGWLKCKRNIILRANTGPECAQESPGTGIIRA
jgi:hypothetical protein